MSRWTRRFRMPRLRRMGSRLSLGLHALRVQRRAQNKELERTGVSVKSGAAPDVKPIGGEAKLLHIWILTDGKIGDRVQCLGVVSRLGASAEEKVIAPGKPWEWLMPRGPVPPKHRPGRRGSPIAPPFPDVAIASGRRMVPYLKAVKAASGGKTFTVFLKDPRIGASAADLIWMPRHDRFRADNVLVTDTGPHPLTREAIADAVASRPAEWDGLPGPRLGLLIGNPISGTRDQAAAIAHFMRQIDHAKAETGSIIVTQSRRTPEPVMAALRDRLAGFPHWIWSPEQGKPLPRAARLLRHAGCDG